MPEVQSDNTHLEPLAAGESSRSDAALISIAVSLKRIADAVGPASEQGVGFSLAWIASAVGNNA